MVAIFLIFSFLLIWAYLRKENRLDKNERDFILLQEKEFAWNKVAKEEIKLLKEKVSEIRESGSTDFLDVLVGVLSPDVLEYRIIKNEEEVQGESITEITSDIHKAILEAMILEIKLETDGDYYYDQAYNIAKPEFQKLIDPFLRERDKISSMEWEDIPEKRLKRLRSLGRLKRN